MTSDDLNLSSFLTSLRKNILKTNASVEAAKTCYLILPKSDLDTINLNFSQSYEDNIK